MRKKRWRPSMAWRAVPGLTLWLVFAGCLCVPPPAHAADKKKPKAISQAVLFGNVFEEGGFSLRGARVVVWNAERPKDRKETATDIQGEFAVRFPAGKAKYVVEVSAKGFAPETKAVEVTGDERVDLTFRLSPAK